MKINVGPPARMGEICMKMKCRQEKTQGHCIGKSDRRILMQKGVARVVVDYLLWTTS